MPRNYLLTQDLQITKEWYRRGGKGVIRRACRSVLAEGYTRASLRGHTHTEKVQVEKKTSEKQPPKGADSNTNIPNVKEGLLYR